MLFLLARSLGLVALYILGQQPRAPRGNRYFCYRYNCSRKSSISINFVDTVLPTVLDMLATEMVTILVSKARTKDYGWDNPNWLLEVLPVATKPTLAFQINYKGDKKNWLRRPLPEHDVGGYRSVAEETSLLNEEKRDVEKMQSKLASSTEELFTVVAVKSSTATLHFYELKYRFSHDPPVKSFFQGGQKRLLGR